MGKSHHVCPFCGGSAHDSGYIISGYLCQKCGYQGSFIIDVDTLEDVKKLNEYSKTHKGENIVPVSNGVPALDSPKEFLIKRNRNYSDTIFFS